MDLSYLYIIILIEICSPNDGVLPVDHRKIECITEIIDKMINLPPHKTNGTYFRRLRKVERYGIQHSLELWGHVAGQQLTTRD